MSAAREVLVPWRCRHCDSTNVLKPAACDRHVLEVVHEPGCPDLVDESAEEAVVYDHGVVSLPWRRGEPPVGGDAA